MFKPGRSVWTRQELQETRIWISRCDCTLFWPLPNPIFPYLLYGFLTVNYKKYKNNDFALICQIVYIFNFFAFVLNIFSDVFGHFSITYDFCWPFYVNVRIKKIHLHSTTCFQSPFFCLQTQLFISHFSYIFTYVTNFAVFRTYVKQLGTGQEIWNPFHQEMGSRFPRELWVRIP